MKKSILITILLLFLIIAFIQLQCAKAEHWVEVVRYEGTSAVFMTAPFTCNYSEWRIRYESNVETHFPMIIPGVYILNITTYPQGEVENSTNYINKISVGPTQGQYYYQLIKDHPGTFYMNISTGYSDNYSIIVEQNIDSVYATATPPSTASPTPTASNPPTWSIPVEIIVATTITIVIIAIASISLVYFKRCKSKTI